MRMGTKKIKNKNKPKKLIGNASGKNGAKKYKIKITEKVPPTPAYISKVPSYISQDHPKGGYIGYDAVNSSEEYNKYIKNDKRDGIIIIGTIIFILMVIAGFTLR